VEINKEMWSTWKSDPITILFFAMMKQREHDATELLIAAEDPMVRGFITCYREVQRVDFEDMEVQ
jgi:hypothetical protein